MSREIIIRREQLYEEVWTEPITKLAKKYELSDVGLLKICRKLQVPVPGRGYWAKKRKPKRPDLPIFSGKQPYFIRQINDITAEATNPDQNEEFKELVAFEKAPENKIIVTTRLSEPHPLIIQTQDVIRPPEEGKETVPIGAKRNILDVRVCHKNLPRALRILDALIKAMEERGLTISVLGEKNTVVSVNGERLQVRLEEVFKMRERRLTPDERIKMLTGGWISDRYANVPTGMLCFHVHAQADNMRKQWCDGKEQKLENCLNEIIIGLIKISAKLTQQTSEQKQRDSERRKQDEISYERIRRAEEDKRLIQRLEEEAQLWERVQRVSAYIDAVEKRCIAVKGSIEPGSKLAVWLQRTKTYVESIDPLRWIGDEPH